MLECDTNKNNKYSTDFIEKCSKIGISVFITSIMLFTNVPNVQQRLPNNILDLTDFTFRNNETFPQLVIKALK